MQELHGETVNYTPKGGDGVPITALIERGVLEAQGPDEARIAYQVVIHVARADVPTLTVGADTVALKKRLTDSADSTLTVVELLDQAGGYWTLGLS